MSRFLLALSALAVSGSVHAQQRPDLEFRFENPRPAYAMGTGPTVCVDDGHNNFHTADGRYAPYAKLLRGDGYQVTAFSSAFRSEALERCTVLVIANPDAPTHTDWAFPHPPAFERDEITDLLHWVRGGGALLLIVDHQPVPGAAGDLGTALGVAMLDGVARPNPGGNLPDMFRLEDGSLTRHPIIMGRDSSETVRTVGTFTGHPFLPSRSATPFLVFGPNAMGYVDLEEHGIPRDEWPEFSIAGWSQAATIQWGRGRVVVLGEAALCSAQLVGTDRRRMGMNHPDATNNPQFCLNVVRWLSRAID